MAGRRKHRGVSIGTVLMLCLTVMVLLGFGAILPKLGGNTQVTIDTGKVLQALSLGEHLPELSLDDIPIKITPNATAAPPAEKQTPAPAIIIPSAPTAAPSAVPTATPQPGGSFTAVFGGSVNIGTELRQEHYFNEAKKYDFQDVMMLLEDHLAADLSMVTLEHTIYAEGKLSDANTTADVLPMLSRRGVNTVGLAHKNAYNFGMDGLKATLKATEKENLAVVGAYGDGASAGVDKRIADMGGVKVALLHYTTDTLADKGRNAMKKDGMTFSVAQDTLADGADVILTEVASARRQGAQVVIVSLNSTSSLGKSAPGKKQIAFAQQLADAGVDVIIGSGSRVVQPVTWLTGNLADGSTKKTLCAYSLGSLFNGSRTNANVAGMLLRLAISYDGQQVKFDGISCVPTYIWRFKQDGRYYYRVTPSNAAAPDGMSESQIDSMERALSNVKKYVGQDVQMDWN